MPSLLQPGAKYSRRFRPQRNINDTLRTREYSNPTRRQFRKQLGDAAIPNSPGTEVAKYPSANVYCGQYSKDGSFFYTCAQGELAIGSSESLS